MLEQRGRRPQRALLHRIRLQRPRPPTPSQTCTPQPAPCCVAGTNLAHGLCGRGGERIHGTAARQHSARARRAPPQHAPPERTILAAPLPGGPCGAHILPQRDKSHGCRCHMPLRTHTPPAARSRCGMGPARVCGRPGCSGSCTATESHGSVAHPAPHPLHQPPAGLSLAATRSRGRTACARRTSPTHELPIHITNPPQARVPSGLAVHPLPPHSRAHAYPFHSAARGRFRPTPSAL